MPVIRSIESHVREVPLIRAFATARDGKERTVTRPVVITIVADDGNVGIGESVPVPYVTGEDQESVEAAVRLVSDRMLGRPSDRMAPLVKTLEAAMPGEPSARAGIEAALLDLRANTSGLSLWRQFGAAVTELETDLTISITADAEMHAREAYDRGFRILKVKVGSADATDDLARIRAIRDAAPRARLRLDANQAFTPDSGMRFLDQVFDITDSVDIVEQPVPADNLGALDEFARRCPVPVFADESVKTAADALRVVSQTRVHGINVKLMKSGVSGALDIVAITRAAGRRLMLGCMLETRRGLAVSVALAAGTGAFDYIDLDSHLLVSEPGSNPYFDEDGPLLRVQGTEPA